MILVAEDQSIEPLGQIRWHRHLKPDGSLFRRQSANSRINTFEQSSQTLDETPISFQQDHVFVNVPFQLSFIDEYSQCPSQ